MDVKDGVFPEKVVANRKKATDEEIKTYEEERRLYYVAVTRAKNQLCIFDFKDSSTFNNQLLGINVKSSADKTKFQKSGKKGIIATDRKDLQSNRNAKVKILPKIIGKSLINN